MFRSSAIPTALSTCQLKENIDSLQNAIYVSQKYKPAEEEDCLICLSPDTSPAAKPAVKTPVYYPVIFSDTVAEKMMGVGLKVRSHMSYTIGGQYPIQFIPKSKLKTSYAKSINFEIKNILTSNKTNHKPDREKFLEDCSKQFRSYPLCQGQNLLISHEGVTFEIVVHALEADSDSPVYFLGENTELTLGVNSENKKLEIRDNFLNKYLPQDFKSLGIGGYEEEINTIMRECFVSRAIPQNILNAYGKIHKKGCLLYGPPGTGKTYIITRITKLFPDSQVMIINGPELLNKYVGESEANIRALFDKAKADYKADPLNCGVHIIVFDELDALAPKRGSRSDSTGINDRVVSQILTMMQGADSPPNVFVFATTNRKDLIDDALLRPGRFDTHVYIGLPKEEYRLKILEIHTDKLVQNKLLAADVDLNYWAKKTEGYSCAELGYLVQMAMDYAVLEDFEVSRDKTKLVFREDRKEIHQTVKVSNKHFSLSFKDIAPAYGVDKDSFHFDRNKFYLYDPALEKIAAEVTSEMTCLDKMNILLHGPAGTGKTELAKYLAAQTGTTNIRLLSPKRFSGLNAFDKLKLLRDEIYRAQETDYGVVILDDLNEILANDVTQELRQEISHLLKASREVGKCLIIATTAAPAKLKPSGLLSLFDEGYELKNIQLGNTLQLEKILKLLCGSFSYQLILPKVVTANDFAIELSIRDLSRAVERFALRHDKKIVLEDFLDFLKLYQSSRMTNAIEEPSLVRVLKTTGSPLHSRKELEPPVEAPKNRVHYVTK